MPMGPAGARRNLARDGFVISPCSPPVRANAGDLAQDPYAAEIFLDAASPAARFRLSTPVSPTRSTESCGRPREFYTGAIAEGDPRRTASRSAAG